MFMISHLLNQHCFFFSFPKVHGARNFFFNIIFVDLNDCFYLMVVGSCSDKLSAPKFG